MCADVGRSDRSFSQIRRALENFVIVVLVTIITVVYPAILVYPLAQTLGQRDTILKLL